MAYAHIPDAQRQKHDKKSEKLHFVGYSIRSKGYRLFDEESRKLVVRRDVTFNETDFGQATHREVKPQNTVDVDVMRSMYQRQSINVYNDTGNHQLGMVWMSMQT